ncbi:hypothetical protein N7533_007807 [Penicillium manginii]|uniref:uncharacterized protein n=1 Tax=Penicillium manginii TaxID=203109 RepID=UPI0025468FC1|nr:uncharacterized protein N7533_007807 [Penicillium manginii]KAJ5750779.1 hypothetical protein N7533_007807 [Penicillium manginii]
MQQYRRAGRPKSKKGCITCKIRHVKCGEEKPECKQCTTTGRKCDGYSSASQKELHANITKSSYAPVVPEKSSISSDSRIVLIPGTRQERQYVHFFCAEATDALSGFFPSDFWNRFLPQMSHHNSTMRHAAAAVGAAYEQYALRAPGENVNEGFALQQYNKAIQLLQEQIQTARASDFDVMLMTCALFSCLEMLRSNQNGAMDHVEGGLKILISKLPSQAANNSSLKFPPEDPTAQPFFTKDYTHDDDDDTPTLVFETLSQARDCITSIKLRALSLLHEIGFILTVPPVPHSPEHQARKKRLITNFHAWHHAFEKMMARPAKEVGIRDPRAPLTLLIEYHVSYFWLCNCNARYETEYDGHWADYLKIVECAEEIIRLSGDDGSGSSPSPSSSFSGSSSSSSFSSSSSSGSTPVTNAGGDSSLPFRRRFAMEAPVTPSLYWTAYKCRDPLLRRRAIRAILQFPSCQGGWENRRHAASAIRIMEIEEGPVSHLPVAERFVQNGWRVVEPLQCSADVKDGEGVSLLLLMRPDGPEGEVFERMEFVEWPGHGDELGQSWS